MKNLIVLIVLFVIRNLLEAENTTNKISFPWGFTSSSTVAQVRAKMESIPQIDKSHILDHVLKEVSGHRRLLFFTDAEFELNQIWMAKIEFYFYLDRLYMVTLETRYIEELNHQYLLLKSFRDYFKTDFIVLKDDLDQITKGYELMIDRSLVFFAGMPETITIENRYRLGNFYIAINYYNINILDEFQKAIKKEAENNRLKEKAFFE